MTWIRLRLVALVVHDLGAADAGVNRSKFGDPRERPSRRENGDSPRLPLPRAAL